MGNPIARHRLGRRQPLVGASPLARSDFEAAVARLGRRARVVGVVVLQLDPRPSTDEALERAAIAAQDAVRSNDVVARTGGAEITVLLPGCTADQAARVARRLQDAVDGSGRPVSAGVGHGTGLDLVDVLRTAGEDLHRRRTGRSLPI